MATTIAEKANDIRNKTYGKEVREALASGIEAIDDTANTAKTIAESVTAAEIERINKEKTRIENENTRIGNENTRIENENTRKSNENTRTKSESERINMEKLRISNESQRVTNEQERITAESTRIKKESERVTEEEIRIANEAERAKNEGIRQINESTRVENENARVQTERNRQADFYTIKTDYTTYKNVMTAESNVAALQANIDKITAGLGGRNLVLDSLNLDKKFMKADDFEGTIQKIEDVYPISKKAFKVECTKGGGYFHFPIFPKTNEKVGRIYTFSFYLLSTKSMELSLGHQCGGGKTVFTATSWEKVVHTWKYTDGQYSSFYFMRKDGWKAGDIVYIADLKIEEGTIASTHTDAPEDLEKIIGDITTLKTDDKLNIIDAINSLETRKSPIGHEHKDIDDVIGNISTLKTFDKSNLTDAINSLQDKKASISHEHNETDITGGIDQWLLPNGYRVFPGGLILQWGTVTATAKLGYATGTFPKPFPNTCFGLNSNMIYKGTVLNVTTTEQVLDLTKFNIYVREGSNAVPQSDISLFWRAIGF